MSNEHGSPIWYELMTPDPVGAKRFYDDVVGWTIGAQPSGSMDYRMIEAPDGAVGGVLRLTDGSMRPGWVVYVGVTDVDATVEKAGSLGGQVLMAPVDLEGVGRFSLLADPQGAAFYVMRGAGVQTTEPFAPGQVGHCGWNELCTTDLDGALGFYGALFGWENRETMDMGSMGGYHFLDLGGTRLGAVARVPGRPPRWSLYFKVADIEVAAERVRAGGGSIDMGPHEVPTGERIVLGTDPQGVPFSLVC